MGMTPSVRPDNKLRFRCPAVGTEEFYLACIMRRYRHWRGESIDRADCATCMNASKCPALEMIREECVANKSIFFAADDRLRTLPARILERVQRIVVLPMHGMHTGIDPARLSQLVGRDAVVPTALAVPAGHGRKAAKACKPDNAVFLDKVDGSIAQHIKVDQE